MGWTLVDRRNRLRLAQPPVSGAPNMTGVFDCDVDVNTGLGTVDRSGNAATA
jgi:hypothetical protein